LSPTMTATTFTPPSATHSSSSLTAEEGQQKASSSLLLREKLLHHVDTILTNQPPGRESLFMLLQLCHPDLALEPSVVEAPVAREKAFRIVKARLHPDKHSSLDQGRVTKLFQNVQTYYIDCCHALADEERTRRASPLYTTTNTRAASYTRSSSTTTTTTTKSSTTTTRSYARRSTFSEGTPSNTSVLRKPLEFDSSAKWTFLKQMPRETPYQAVSTNQLHHHLAYACLNQRGAIVHGQAIDCTYQVPVNLVDVVETTTTTTSEPWYVADIWKQAGLDHPSHCTTCTTIEQIKHEIANHGPVVSVSFVLEEQFMYSSVSSSSRHAGNFSERHVGQVHPLLLVGWTMTATGEVWLVQALRGPTFSVGMGQFHIDACCLAPSPAVLKLKGWQAPGPYWDVADLELKCADWNTHFNDNSTTTTTTTTTTRCNLEMIDILPLTSTDVEALADLWNVGLNAVVVERRTFVLRDKQKMAHSRRVILRDMARVPFGDSKVWKVTLSVVRK
jgi:hypothetical protein